MITLLIEAYKHEFWIEVTDDTKILGNNISKTWQILQD